jgi:hypothetical protein
MFTTERDLVASVFSFAIAIVEIRAVLYEFVGLDDFRAKAR